MDEHTEKVKSYIAQQLQAGQTPDEIHNQLTAAGWPDTYIQQGFEAMQSAVMPAALNTGGTAAPAVPAAFGRRRGRIRTGWVLLKTSLALLKGNRYLLRYLLMTWVVIIAIEAVMFCMWFFGNRLFIRSFVNTSGNENLYYYIYAFLSYLIIYFVINFYAAALSANILDIFQGHRDTYDNYIKKARSKAGTIFVFSLIQAIVGMFLEYVVERIRYVGWLIAWLLGTMWSLGTLFVIPIIMNSDVSATQSIKMSVKFFKQTWGENIVAKTTVNVPLALINFALIICLLPIIFFAAMSGSMIVVWIGFIVWLILIITLAIVGSFSNTVVNMALYYFAVKREVPPTFTSDMLNNVFRERKHFKHGKSSTPATNA